MADDIRTPVLKSLGETDYYGMDPAQMLQVAENERANDTLNYNMAKALSDQQERAKQLAIDHMQTKRDMQFKQFKEQFDQKAKIVDLELSRRRLDINSKMADATAAKNDILAKQYQLELDKTEESKRTIAAMGNTTFKINGTNVPMPIGTILAMKQMGAPVVFQPESKVKDVFIDTKTNKAKVLFTDGSVKNVSELSGGSMKAISGGGTTVNVGDKAFMAGEVHKAIDTASMLDTDYWSKKQKTVLESDRSYRMLSNSPDPNDKAQARQLLINAGLKDAEAKTEDPITYVPGKGIYSVETAPDGSVIKDKFGKPKLKQRYAGDPK
jgi:hypothetical protein